MHDIISERAQKSPNKIAIFSWDGSLSYGQIDRYSTIMADSLRELGVELHDFLSVCFEKSKWTVVAVLAVMKAGATMVMMDPTLPLARLQNMAIQVGAKFMLSSRKQHYLSTSILPEGKTLVVEADTFTKTSDFEVLPLLPIVPASALMYIIFTSGSTGTPKGVKISHQTYTSSAFPRAKIVGYNENSRVLDFASYAFDVSIDSMFLTLANGGCLCIPSDEDRLNDINGVIRRMKINYAGITPSVARILDLDVIESLEGLGLGGEAASVRDVTHWGKYARIIIGYGPCECTIGCTINGSAATGRDYITIGPGNGATIWVVDPDDHETLMPIGAVGELLVEGPIVGQGYLNDPEKTATAFIHDPKWLVAGHKEYTGRRGRLYKTGDLGRYDPDGTGEIVFVGRKDTQVKLRGQRVELGEIESQLKARLPAETSVIAEVLVSSGSGGQPTLVAFIAPQSTKTNNIMELESVPLVDELRSVLNEANADLAKVLPRYMVPTAYIPVNFIPTLVSGKSDRKRLRQFGAMVDLRLLDLGGAKSRSSTRELSDLEQRLRHAWGLTLKLDPDTIQPNDNFFVLGGDSLAAMRLVSVCRDLGLDVSVTNTFAHPTLSAMAEVVSICDTEAQVEILDFSMILQPFKDACIDAAQACRTSWEAIQDIYPCTPTQESLFTFSLKSVKPYVAQRLSTIPSHISSDAWKRAWETVVAEMPILRTRVAQLQDPGLQQVVLKENIRWIKSTDLSQYLENDRNERMNLGESLARYAIIDDVKTGKRHMVWTVHHVLYDGWSEPVILEKVRQALQSQKSQMREFVKYVRDTNEVAMQEFWRKELSGATGPQFPRLPSRDFLPTPDTMVEHQIPLKTGAGFPFTLATVIRGAWALVASQFTGSNDVVFGETLTGRDIPLREVEGIVGPLIATVPVRVQVDRTTTVESYLRTIQQGGLDRTPYQHMGMQHIRKVSRDAQHACEASTGLVIQLEPEYTGNDLGFEQGDVVREALHFNPYPLMLACGLRKGGFRVCANFDSSLVEVAQMQRILLQLETACLQLVERLDARLDQVSCLPEAELNDIWSRNQTPPLSLDQVSGGFRADGRIKQGSVYPPAVVSWVCNPWNSSLLSPIGCTGELWLEGDLLPGEAIESPAWLLAGSSAHVGRTGRVQPTGDMVQLLIDGSLIFIGRKENVVQGQGQAVDITELEAHLSSHLSSSTRAAVALFQPQSASTQQPPEKQLAIFVEQQPSEEDTVELMWMNHNIAWNTSDPTSFNTTILAAITHNLTGVLKRLDKSIQNSLPSHMVPSAYIVVDKLPMKGQQIDHNVLNELASYIPEHVLKQLRQGFQEAWKRDLVQSSLTDAENILRSAWAKILGISADQIDPEDNFFRLGGDSVLAMRLVSKLRMQGHGLTVADIFHHMRLGDAAKVLKVNQATKPKPQSYEAFSMLGSLDVESFLSNVIRPQLADQSWSIQDVFPVTDSQALDVIATILPPRTSVQYTMLYFDQGSINREKLFYACRELVKAHDILRTVFVEHESTLLQVVLGDLEAPLTTHLADKDLEEFVTELCSTHDESTFQLGSSFLSMFHIQGTDDRECLVIGLSHAQYDGISLPSLLRDLEALYSERRVADAESFSSYMAQINRSHIQTKAVDYWKNLLYGSSLSVLAGTTARRGDKGVFQSKPVGISQVLGEVTIASLLTAAWAVVLARRLHISDVTFGSITSGRTVDVANVESIMGPCYQFTPVRVSFQPQWTAMDLLQFVQTQVAESASHDILGFDKISKQCTQWPSEARFFDSIVHHQDSEDFDTMPFADGTCKVDILNPQGDAATPLKVVSFFQSGQVHVGVVGSERDTVLVESILNEVAVTVDEFASNRLDHVLIM